MRVTPIGPDPAKRVVRWRVRPAGGRVVRRKRLSRPRVLAFFAKLPRCWVGMEERWWGTLPGERDRQARPRGAADASLLRPAPREADQARCRRGGRDRRGRVGPRARRVKARRGRLAEGGAVAATGLTQMAERLALVAEPEDRRAPPPARPVLALPVEPLRMVDDKVRAPEPQRLAWQRTREVSQRLVTLPAVGPITATARVATLGDPAFFTAARPFSAWLGRTPRRPSTGGREWLGGISKRGEGHRRRLLLSGGRPRPPGEQASTGGASRLGSMPGSRGDPAMDVTLALASRTARLAGAVHGPRPTLPRRHGRRKRCAAGAGEPAT